jgi:hypothetical protein
MRFKEINMAYIYESIQPGLFNFSIPGQNKTVSLFTGSRVVVENKLTGGLLRVLRFVGETENETTVDNTITEPTKQKAALNPLVILVSSNTKKPGPIEKANKSPQGIAVSMSCKIKCSVFSY